MALTTNLLMLPVAAGLMAGTGAVAAFVLGPTSAPASTQAIANPVPVEIAAPPKRCEEQTWPYIDNRCMAGTAQQERKVRLVVVPRTGEPITEIPVPASVNVTAAPGPEKLVTRDTVARPTEVQTPQAAPVPQIKPTAKRRSAREVYQVPSDSHRRETRAVIVVRPLRLDAFGR